MICILLYRTRVSASWYKVVTALVQNGIQLESPWIDTVIQLLTNGISQEDLLDLSQMLIPTHPQLNLEIMKKALSKMKTDENASPDRNKRKPDTAKSEKGKLVTSNTMGPGKGEAKSRQLQLL